MTEETMAMIEARIDRTGIIVVLRVADGADAVRIGGAVVGAGCDVVEVSFTTPGAAGAIEDLATRYPQALLGAGTVLRPGQARTAVTAGARFLLSPVYDAEVDAVARALEVPYIPGVFTAADVWAAVKADRTLVKPFPASLLGIAGVRALFEPFGPVRMVPTGGLGTADVAAWRKAGAVAVGLGGAITRAEDPARAAAEALAAARRDGA